MTADLLRRAADAMVAEAERLEALDIAAVPAPWYALGDSLANDIGKCTCGSPTGYPHEPHCGLELVGGPFGITPDGEAPDADLAAHRRNTLARDAATLRALEPLVRAYSKLRPSACPIQILDYARAFLGEPAATPPDGTAQPDPKPGPGFVHRASS